MNDVDLYPAIDIRSGRVVRLTQGDYDKETVYGEDPLEVAHRFADEGARWIHIVDLDAALSGDPVNRNVISRIATALWGKVKVQTGGGVRTVDDARTLAEAGISRVVMGSAAVSKPELVEEAAKIVDVAVGLDHRNGRVSVHGWTQEAGMTLVSALGMFPAASAFIITDIARDGMLVGPDVDGLVAAAAVTSVPIVASGGGGSIDDLRELRDARVIAGVIVGRALYEGKFTLSEALSVVSR